jgi:hypothetical protein
VVKLCELEQLRMGHEFRAQGLAQEWQVARLVELNRAFGYRIAHPTLCRFQLKPRTPRPRDEGLEDEPAEIRT